MLLVEQELLILSIHIWFLFGFMVLNLSSKCCMDYCLSFHIFYLAIVLSVLRFTTSDNPFEALLVMVKDESLCENVYIYM